MSAIVIDRGRGPELKGTRVTVYRVMDYVRAGDPPERIAEELDLTEEQTRAALDYITSHRSEVETAYDEILRRVRQPNPPQVEAGAAANWDDLRRRIRSCAESQGRKPFEARTKRGQAPRRLGASPRFVRAFSRLIDRSSRFRA